VLTCLNQFTASEIMTGNNKVSCERCTEQHKKSKVLILIILQFLLNCDNFLFIFHRNKRREDNLSPKYQTNVN